MPDQARPTHGARKSPASDPPNLDNGPMPVSKVAKAYAARASEYVERFGDIASASELDRQAILAWARGLTGPIMDVGSGPGQWTHFLAQHGFDAQGIDPTPEFVASAQSRYPGTRFQKGSAEHLEVEDNTLGGILAWYSLIHVEPALIDIALTEFARSLRPAGSLAIGFFTGPALQPFQHAVSTAYYWPVELLSMRVTDCGFNVTTVQTRSDPDVRAHGLIIATKRSPQQEGAPEH